MDAATTSGLKNTATPAIPTAITAASKSAAAPRDAASYSTTTPPLPPDFVQKGEVTRAQIAEVLPSQRAMREPERVLKPYGVAMLPDTPTDAPRQDDAAADETDPVTAD